MRATKASRRQADVRTEPVTDEEKADARARVLGKLFDLKSGVISGESWREVQEALKLEDMTPSLFRSCIWHLRVGDRDFENKPRILVDSVRYPDHVGSPDRKRVTIKVIKPRS